MNLKKVHMLSQIHVFETIKHLPLWNYKTLTKKQLIQKAKQLWLIFNY